MTEVKPTLSSVLRVLADHFDDFPYEVEGEAWRKFRVYFRWQEFEDGTAWWEFSHPAVLTRDEVWDKMPPWGGELDAAPNTK